MNVSDMKTTNGWRLVALALAILQHDDREMGERPCKFVQQCVVVNRKPDSINVIGSTIFF